MYGSEKKYSIDTWKDDLRKGMVDYRIKKNIGEIIEDDNSETNKHWILSIDSRIRNYFLISIAIYLVIHILF